ncbi:MAG: hypothetical protein AUJ20_11300 [Comamonadaceae bacterium CG1_02_60_18]|nr:MAG: hypothetical protein AUJ20_11300 [Comamonadaceae bacterium CG1_02_60_18]PIQ52906.1 MAG: general secretion pathway protein GspM [Comamonadaceae bacterium CG12_big_fil_rev_8_21_14_0_65_59_15]
MSARELMQSRWQRVAPREQRSLLLAAAVLGAALLWWLGLAPALALWRSASAQHQQLDTQLQHMQALQAQARSLQALPTPDAATAQRALTAALQALGSDAKISTQGERLSVTFKGVSAQALAQTLSASRQNAHRTPTEAHLKRGDTGWDGTLVFTLPAP